MWFSRKNGKRTGAAVEPVARHSNQGIEALLISADHKRRLTAVLDEVLSLFTPAGNASAETLLAEVMAVADHSRQLLTLVLRPDSSSALHTRRRAGEGIAGNMLRLPVTFTGDVETTNSDAAHLQTTKSVLCVPLFDRQQRLLGVLNVESKVPGTFTAESVRALTQTGAVERTAAVLAELDLQALDDLQVVSQVLQSAEDQIFAIIDPEDLSDFYHEVLRIAAQLNRAQDVDGGILLLRDEAQNLLVTSTPATAPKEFGWIVVTATIGDYQTERREWPLNEPSVTQKVFETHETQRIPNVRDVSYYKSGGERFASGSELNVPLTEDGRIIGVIDLLCPTPDAFSAEDAAYVERLARYAAQAIKRAADIDAKQQAQQQLHDALALQDIIAPLFNNTPLDDLQIASIRSQALNFALARALTTTDSELGEILLATTSAEAGPPSIEVQVVQGPLLADARRRWPVTEGITGKAFSTRTVQVVADAQHKQAAPEYFASFAGVRSELAVPLVRGDEVLGVLDLNSAQPHHFTNAGKEWAVFLAKQIVGVLTAIQLATRTHQDLQIAALSDHIDRGIDEMRTSDLDGLRDARNALLQQLLDTMIGITHASSGRVLLSVNAYRPTGEVDLDGGRFVEVVTSPPTTDTTIRHFTITPELSRLLTQPATERGLALGHGATEPYVPQTSSSAAIFPLYEGGKVVGALSLESTTSDHFTGELMSLAMRAGPIASDIITSARVRLEKLQADMLRGFEIEILRAQMRDYERFMLQVLQSARDLSGINAGWGQVLLLRHYPGDPSNTVRTASEFSVRFDGTRVVREDHPLSGTFTVDHPELRYVGFNRVRQSGMSWVSLDISEDDRTGLPWIEAGSLLCVPLVRPAGDGSVGPGEVFGLISLASPYACNFSDADIRVMNLFAQTVNIGLRNATLLGARQDVAQQLTHDFGKVMGPLLNVVEDVSDPLRQAVEAPEAAVARQQAQLAYVGINQARDLVNLANNLIFWFVDLSDEGNAIRDEPVEPLAVVDLVDDLRESMQTFAHVLTGRTVHWEVSDLPMYVAGSATRNNLMRAALFKYIENALKYGPLHDVTIQAQPRDSTITFTVRNTGPQIDPTERDMIFELEFRGSNVRSATSGSGIGLFQVKRIASLLKGDVEYQPEGADSNLFILRLPSIPG